MRVIHFRTLFVLTAFVLTAAPGAAQTPAERLEQGIYLEETVGDLDAAARIYGELARSPGVPREIAAYARAQLTESGRRQAVSGGRPATPARDPRRAAAAADKAPSTPIARPKVHVERITFEGNNAQAGGAPQPGGCCGMFSANYDVAKAVSVNGTVTRVDWINPQAVIYVQGTDGLRWAFTIAAPNQMIRFGLNKNAFKPGEQVHVWGYLATGAADSCPAALPTSCATLENGAMHGSASTITREDGTTVFDRVSAELLLQQSGDASPGAR